MNTLIGKVFVPLSLPGFVALGAGMLATVKGTYDLIEIAAVALGLIVVAVAGVFTIRSNVAKVWHEQADAEKARNETLVKDAADALKAHAAELALLLTEYTNAIATLRHELELERDAKDRALADLADANKRTDLTPVMLSLGQLSSQLSILAGVLTPIASVRAEGT